MTKVLVVLPMFRRMYPIEFKPYDWVAASKWWLHSLISTPSYFLFSPNFAYRPLWMKRVYTSSMERLLYIPFNLFYANNFEYYSLCEAQLFLLLIHWYYKWMSPKRDIPLLRIEASFTHRCLTFSFRKLTHYTSYDTTLLYIMGYCYLSQ